VVIDASVLYEGEYPVGSRVVKHAGQYMPTVQA
jgi:hypothetical protein